MVATVKIGMDQWVVANANAGTTLYTAGLSGCVALILQSNRQIALTHVASDAHRHNFQRYEFELDLMLVAMRGVSPVTRASMIAVGRYDQPPFTLIKKWVADNHIPVTELPSDNGIMVLPNWQFLSNKGLSRDIQNKGYVRLFEPEAAEAITNWGKLLQAAMPSKAIDGVAEDGETDD